MFAALLTRMDGCIFFGLLERTCQEKGADRRTDKGGFSRGRRGKVRYINQVTGGAFKRAGKGKGKSRFVKMNSK